MIVISNDQQFMLISSFFMILQKVRSRPGRLSLVILGNITFSFKVEFHKTSTEALFCGLPERHFHQNLLGAINREVGRTLIPGLWITLLFVLLGGLIHLFARCHCIP